MSVAPPVKWVGGKTQLIQSVLGAFPQQIVSYYEPFVGGGSVLLGVLARVASGHLVISGGIHASDSNPRLVWMYKHIQTNHEELARRANDIADTYSGIVALNGRRDAQSERSALESRESYYYWLRHKFNASDPASIESAALFLIINRLCFRGLYRIGPNGFNVPFGHCCSRPGVPSTDRMQRLSELLAPVEFEIADFKDACSRADQPGDLVYLDPPYVPVAATSFVGYTDGGFPAASHERLLSLLRELPARGVTVVMSNSVAPVVLQVCQGLDVREVTAKRRVNSRAPGSTAQEVIVVARPSKGQ